MVLKRLRVLGALAILPAVAQVSNTSPKAVLLNAFRLQHGPMRLLVQHDDGSVDSTNWSGYAVTGAGFTSSRGSWKEPSIKCNKTNDTELAAFWVGLDGYNDSTVEQTGTLAGCTNGVVSHVAWYEFYPKEAIIEIPGLTVNAGNEISTAVTYSATTKKFTLTITNVTTGKHFSTTGTQSGTQRASAEWIAEAPSSGTFLYPLPNFGTALFGKDSTGVANTNYAKDGAHILILLATKRGRP